MKASEAPEPVAAKEKDEEAAPADLSDPRIAAKERARRRSQMTTQLFTEDGEVELSRINSAEVQYQVSFSSLPPIYFNFYLCFWLCNLLI